MDWSLVIRAGVRSLSGSTPSRPASRGSREKRPFNNSALFSGEMACKNLLHSTGLI